MISSHSQNKKDSDDYLSDCIAYALKYVGVHMVWVLGCNYMYKYQFYTPHTAKLHPPKPSVLIIYYLPMMFGLCVLNSN